MTHFFMFWWMHPLLTLCFTLEIHRILFRHGDFLLCLSWMSYEFKTGTTLLFSHQCLVPRMLIHSQSISVWLRSEKSFTWTRRIRVELRSGWLFVEALAQIKEDRISLNLLRSLSLELVPEKWFILHFISFKWLKVIKFSWPKLFEFRKSWDILYKGWVPEKQFRLLHFIAGKPIECRSDLSSMAAKEHVKQSDENHSILAKAKAFCA